MCAHCCGAWRPPMSIDISCLQGSLQQTCCSGVQRAINRTDRRTDRQTYGQTPDCYTDPAKYQVSCLKLSIVAIYTSNDVHQNMQTLRKSEHTHTRLTALFPGVPKWAGTRKVKPIWILVKQETVSGSGISWAICKSAPCSRQTTTPAPNHSVFYRLDALPAAQPTVSKHWRNLNT